MYHYVTVVSLIMLGAVALLEQGCASTSDSLTLSSVNEKKDFSQAFSRAYASIDGDGDYDLVLVSDPNDDVSPQAGGGAAQLQPQAATPRQLVHIRVYWNARGGRAAHPVTTNASIRWYMLADGPADSSNMLEYSGCGLVVLDSDGQMATFSVRGAFMQPVACRGCMTDPIGPGTITGTVTAKMDAAQVKQLLAEVDAVDASLNPQANAGAATGADNSTATR
ncbi:MAG TPA: hypothetical protein VMD30_01695 [Tepidisphaeraceae bacterium]|nr:hypothetical protein [Tepidisphaeraceae bacterium]